MAHLYGNIPKSGNAWNLRQFGHGCFVLSHLFVFETGSHCIVRLARNLLGRPDSDSQIQLPLPEHAEISGVPTTPRYAEYSGVGHSAIMGLAKVTRSKRVKFGLNLQ